MTPLVSRVWLLLLVPILLASRVALAEICGELCPPGSSVPAQFKEVAMLPQTGNQLTCAEIESLIDSTPDEMLCRTTKMKFMLECCLVQQDLAAISGIAGASLDILAQDNSTLAPSTAGPTTASPTSFSPTTDQPTPAPSTLMPTTANPTTVSPTTASPTTASPTTAAPTTSPTTQSPTVTTGSPSAAPTTAKPTTQSTTDSPTTQLPTSPPTPIPTTTTPTITPTRVPTLQPTPNPTTGAPTTLPPTKQPGEPTASPTTGTPTTQSPTQAPTPLPTTAQPTTAPTRLPTKAPTLQPTPTPTSAPPTKVAPTIQPGFPTATPTTATPTTQAPTRAPTQFPTTSSPTIPGNTCTACSGDNILVSNALPDGVLCGDWLQQANLLVAGSEECLLEQAAGIKYCGCTPPSNAQPCNNLCGGAKAIPDARGLTCESLVGMVNADGFRTCSLLSTKYSSHCECTNANEPVCGFCPNGGDFVPNKPFPTPQDLSIPLPNVFGDVSNLSCQGLASLYAVQSVDKCAAIGSNLFGNTVFDLRAWCECPGVLPPQICGDLCVEGTTLMEERHDLIPDAELGLTCLELHDRAKYLSDSSACGSVQTYRQLCCTSTPAPTTASPTTGSPSTVSPTTGTPTTGAPTTSQPTTGAPSTLNPTITPGQPTAAPTTASPTTLPPSRIPTSSPTTAEPTTISPTTSSPTVSTGNPTGAPTTVTPTTAQPTTTSPTTAVPSASPTNSTLSPTSLAPTVTSTGNETTTTIRVNSVFQMYNQDGLTSVEASQPGNFMMLETAWRIFVQELVRDVESRPRQRRRRLAVALIPLSATVYGIVDVKCPTNTEPPVPEGANCQNVIGRYDLRLTNEDDPAAVRKQYYNETDLAINQGKLQESLEWTDPSSPFTIIGTPDDSTASEDKLEWWLILIIVLLCLIGLLCCICGGLLAHRKFKKPKQPSQSHELALKLVDEDEESPPFAHYPNTVMEDHTVGGEEESDDESDDGFFDIDLEDVHSSRKSSRRDPAPAVTFSADDESMYHSHRHSVSWRDPEPPVTVCAEESRFGDDHESIESVGTDEEFTGPRTVTFAEDVDEVQVEDASDDVEDCEPMYVAPSFDSGKDPSVTPAGADPSVVRSVYRGGEDPSVPALYGDPSVPGSIYVELGGEDPSVMAGPDPSVAPSRRSSLNWGKDPSVAMGREPSVPQTSRSMLTWGRDPSVAQLGKDPSVATSSRSLHCWGRDPSTAQLREDPSVAPSRRSLMASKADPSTWRMGEDPSVADGHNNWGEDPLATPPHMGEDPSVATASATSRRSSLFGWFRGKGRDPSMRIGKEPSVAASKRSIAVATDSVQDEGVPSTVFRVEHGGDSEVLDSLQQFDNEDSGSGNEVTIEIEASVLSAGADVGPQRDTEEQSRKSKDPPIVGDNNSQQQSSPKEQKNKAEKGNKDDDASSLAYSMPSRGIDADQEERVETLESLEALDSWSWLRSSVQAPPREGRAENEPDGRMAAGGNEGESEYDSDTTDDDRNVRWERERGYWIRYEDDERE